MNLLRSRRLVPALTATTAVASTLLAAASPAGAQADPDRHLTPATHFTVAADGSSGLTASGDALPDIDVVKSTIRAYYGASSKGIADKTTSPYISELADLQAATLARLPTVDPAAHKAVVFDADDTTLWTYDMEDGAMHFSFDPVLQNTWVTNEQFPAVPGMPDFVTAVAAKGYTIFGITGRGESQEPATVDNLARDGYAVDGAPVFTAENFYTKPSVMPSYVTCALPKCTTVEYKANTRKHIEQDLGYDIALNVGDQFSDLQGGYADQSLKLPNPTYYLPSPDIAGAPESDATLAPRTEFTMAADGSSGRTEGGEGIPNIDAVKSTIRTYYRASSAGIADKASSPYIAELAGIEADNRDRLVNACRRELRAGLEPAVVFDADDTTLWTYDMEDGAMKFVFDPVAQDRDWVQPQAFPAVPGMVDLVNAVGDAGCTVVGITGRRDTQRAATLGNLAKVGYRHFSADHYFTRWNSGTTPDPTIYGGTGCATGSCSTVQYKSAARAYLESQGFDVIANFGDQFSDLAGGHADRTVKLPNPTYYLP
ncbi:HAD family acid phosphatase [Nocardioides jiangxiensis]|uniref:HAD family acid phosphatase n=1 Tax=Nocardioides jiangxiensis TaxID=3064524 RepID=A0ABT9B542_9ACTN|nr:HAD family acid phosphatase [Nocardioides sp. WY-20]MDO7868727.1 HAD family acid phosphatase [Nocardioides sp. WY-20]